MIKKAPPKTARPGPWANGQVGKMRLFPLYYSPGKKLFQIVVKLSDAPGSYRSILELLSPRVNLVGTATYSMEDGTAIFNGISESLKKTETATSLKRLILSSRAAIDAEVRGGRGGLLVDTFNAGPEVTGEDYMLFSRGWHAHMFNEVVRMLGSGGEALLFNEGETLGRMRGGYLASLLGLKRFKAETPYLAHFITARGWGRVEMESGGAGPLSKARVVDCFECSAESGSRAGCSFLRGYFTGAAAIVDGGVVSCREVRCHLRGADACEFEITRVAK